MLPALAITVFRLATAEVVLGGESPDLASVPVESGLTCDEAAPLDRLMRRTVSAEGIPGASLAVCKGDELLYARGFGWANREARRPVRPASRFRLASLSKPITAVAILCLVDQNRLALDDRVIDLLPDELVPHNRRSEEFALRRITVRQLLSHTAGWDRDQTFDPMFAGDRIAESLELASPPGPNEVIRFMLRRLVDFEPGERYAYSNFGYCLLGRAIEHVTGHSYEEAVAGLVLDPLELRSMRLGRTPSRERAENEVSYYDRGAGDDPARRRVVPLGQVTWSLEAMDAHGGWIGTAEDVARFGAAVAGAPANGFLSQSAVEAMCARPCGAAGFTPDGQPKDVYYGLGWLVRVVGDGTTVNRWHTGSLPGTSSLLVLRHDGCVWAVLMNCHQSASGQRPTARLDRLLHGAVDAVTRWPRPAR